MLLDPKLAFIFDLDGVIVDSMPLHEEAWEVYLRRLGVKEATDIARRMHGRRNDDIVRDFLGPDSPAAEVEAHGAAKEALFRDMMGARLPEFLVGGVADVLRDFQGVPTGLGTNAEPANVDFVLNGSGLRRYFQVIANGTHVERPKPAPDIYAYVAAQLGFAPHNCIVFEDSPTGIEAAKSAGARVVGLLTHANTLENVDFAVPDFTKLELREWLAQQRAY